jgi:hypothetical protein
MATNAGDETVREQVKQTTGVRTRADGGIFIESASL